MVELQAVFVPLGKLPLSSFEPQGMITSGSDLITFGRHMGKHYNQTWQEDPQYCHWVMMMIEQEVGTSSALKRCAQYCVMIQRSMGFEEVPAAGIHEATA